MEKLFLMRSGIRVEKFHFRLEKYHNFKEQEEKQRLELFRARGAYQEEADKLAALQGKTIELISQTRYSLQDPSNWNC